MDPGAGAHAGGADEPTPREARLAHHLCLAAACVRARTPGQAVQRSPIIFPSRGQILPLPLPFPPQLLSWVAYLSVQGSSPGYLEPGQAEQHEVALEFPRAGADADTVRIDASSAGDGRGKGDDSRPAAASSAAAAFRDDDDDNGDDDVRAGRAPPPARSRIAGGGVPPTSSSSSPPVAASASSAAHRGEESDSASLLDVNAGGGAVDIPDYDPEHAADPVGLALEASAAAERGWRDCKQCHAKQGPRAHHCRACGKCVPLFDHHCDVINTCIGERNRARFWAFLGAQSLALAFAIGILNTSFVWRREMGDWVGANAGAIATLIALWILQAFVFGLLVFHTWLACTNTTTYETSTGAQRLWYLAGTEPRDCDLPFSQGVCTNLRLFCCVLDACCVPACVQRALRKASGRDGTGEWAPHEWERARHIDRETSDVCSNLWENRFWSCC